MEKLPSNQQDELSVIEKEMKKEESLLGNAAHDNLCDLLAKLSEEKFRFVDKNW